MPLPCQRASVLGRACVLAHASTLGHACVLVHASVLGLACVLVHASVLGRAFSLSLRFLFEPQKATKPHKSQHSSVIFALRCSLSVLGLAIATTCFSLLLLTIAFPSHSHGVSAKFAIKAFLPALNIFGLKVCSPSDANGGQLLFVNCSSQSFFANPELLDCFGQ